MAVIGTSLSSEHTASAFLQALRKDIASHPGVGHSLLGRMKMDPRSREDFRVLAGQHYPLVANFTNYMELLLLRAPNSEAKSWLAKVLVDEYGERSEGDDHAAMYRRFMHAAGVPAGGEDQVRLHPEVVAFIQEHYRICTEEPFLVGLGAVGPGHEWSIPAMFELAVAGLRKAGFAEADIAYWTCHLEQDLDHGAWLEQALERFCDSEQARAEVRHGAMLSLAARERFWWGVTDKIHTETTRRSMPGVMALDQDAERAQPTLASLKRRLEVRMSFA